MTKVIDFNRPIKDVCDEYPEVVEIMKELGFTRIANPVMLKTVGRRMTIRKGSMMQKIPIEHIRQTFVEKGFTVKDEDNKMSE